MGYKCSIIWLLTTEEFTELIKSSSTYKDVLVKLGLAIKSGGNYKTLKQRINKDNIDVHHIEQNKQKFKGILKKLPIDEILVKNSNYSTGKLKQRILNCGLIKNQCSKCGLKDSWQGEHITLQLDHINGDHNDNRLENLRIMCPNCHSQTKTFGGRNNKKYIGFSFCKCGSKKNRFSSTCRRCRKVKTKILWPSKEELKILLWRKPIIQIAKELGVSNTAVCNHSKKLGLSKPPIGYWSRSA
jgi:5-methylcytosine-specific restriction endonuclease McrA